MSSLTRSAISRLNNDIATLRSKIADEVKKEADATGKINRAGEKARKATSQGTVNSALGELQRAQNDLERATKNRAQHERSVATKTAELLRYQTRLTQEEESERKKHQETTKRADLARERRIRELERQLQHQASATLVSASVSDTGDKAQECDCFISHASEDKEGFVRALAAALTERGVKFFYDELSIGWGDSLRRRIDNALSRSKFGVVVLSEAFFRKEWPQRELDGLVQMEVAGKTKILPIWHKVTKDEVAAFSPMLADKRALNTTDHSVAEIADKLAELSR
jgi:hypothetical protein